jgi:hypothetical protein
MNCTVFAKLETLRLLPNDLGQALTVFRQQYGREPAVIGIANCGDNRAIIAEARQRGFTVIHEPKGMLAFEIWMYSEISGAPITTDREIATEDRILATTKSDPFPSCQKSEGVSRYPSDGLSPFIALSERPKKLRGRPKSDVSADEIQKLRSRGLGAKAIASQLRAKGYSISFRTVHRILTGERQGCNEEIGLKGKERG